MKFSYYDLGNLSGGEVVEVSLSGNAANVFLVDSSNFSAYRAGRRYSYYAGHATRSTEHLKITRSGH